MQTKKKKLFPTLSSDYYFLQNNYLYKLNFKSAQF